MRGYGHPPGRASQGQGDGRPLPFSDVRPSLAIASGCSTGPRHIAHGSSAHVNRGCRADAGVCSNVRIHAGSLADASDHRREPRLRHTLPAESFKIEGMSNRSRPTQAKRIREKALQEKRQQKATRRQDAKDRRDQRGPGAAEGEDPDIAGIVLGPQPHPYLEPDELDPEEEQ